MRKKLLTAFAFSLINLTLFAQFTANRIVVFRVGNGAAALSNASTVARLQEYTYTGTPGFTRILDSTGNNRIVVSGSATSEGMISNSPDYTFLIVPGYDTTSGIASIASTTSANVNRKLVGLFSSGFMFTLAKTGAHFSANNIRSATISGNNMWAVGGNTGLIGGLGHVDTVISSTLTNMRCVSVCSNRLFISTGSGTTRGIYRVNFNGLPVNSGNVMTSYINDGGTASPFQFSFNPDTSVCYIADDRAISSGGGIQKWVRTGSNWSKVYTLGTGTGSTVGARGLIVNWAGSNPVIFATTAEASANRLISITDTGALTLPVVLDTAAINTAFRGLAFSPGSNPLPVTFGNITVKSKLNANVLNWATYSEQNNHGFEVERNANGQNFETVGFVKGAGNSSSVRQYSFIDTEIDLNKNYCYRLKQIDFDGAFEYSKTVCAAARKVESATGISTQPNPFNHELVVELNTANEGSAMVELVDLMGKVITSKQVTVSKAYHNVTFDTNNLNNGIYFVRVNQNGIITTRKVVKR